MKGSKVNTFWTVYGIAAALLLGGAGYYLFKSHSEYAASTGGYRATRTKVEKLVTQPIYPAEENVEKLTTIVDQFETEVESLHENLREFQKPLEQGIDPTQFPQILRAAIEDFRTYALEEKVIVPENFYLGMNSYETGIPRNEATPILDYELEAIQYLLRMIIDAGADEIYSLTREETPQERGEPDPETGATVVKYTLQVSFEIPHDGFQEFLNRISNEKEYFFLARVLRIDNEEKFGPPRNVIREKVVRDRDTGQVVTEFPTDSTGNTISGGDYVVEDATVIFGDENLCVTAILDLCRFPAEGPPVEQTAAPNSDRGANRNR